AFNSSDCLRLTSEKLVIIPESGTTQHEMAVVVGESFGDPKAMRVCGLREIPWAKFEGTQPLHVPDVKELVCDCAQRVVVNSGLAEGAGLDDLGGREMLHAIARVIVSREMDQKRVFRELRRSPQRDLRAHDLFDVLDQRGPFPSFRPKRMNHDVI